MLRGFVVVLLFGSTVFSQVRISTVGAAFKQHGPINVEISNASKSTATYCVEVGQTSFKAAGGAVEDMEATPIPFYVQSQNGNNWGTLVIGPDIGSRRHAVSLKSGETQQYPFRLGDSGRMRLVLNYWRGELERACESPKGKQTVWSNTFVVN